ncbi:MAG: BamA/TamA family outer membrane protein [Elusimicrobiota bacterium]
MLKTSALGALLFLAQAQICLAQTPIPAPESQLPQKPSEQTASAPGGALLEWMIHPLKNGMALFLPSIDTDPNRGVTYGVMPIWVFQSTQTKQIQYIHAPSVTYNQYFGWNPTYRLYYYPNAYSNLVLRGSWDRYENEVFASYENQRFLNRNIDAFLEFQDNVDASQRFFGLGPDSQLGGQTNYVAHYIQEKASIGIPLGSSDWKIYATNHTIAERTTNGPIPGFSPFEQTYPTDASSARQTVNEWRMSLGYDGRDSTVTPTRGAYLRIYGSYSAKNLGSGYDYDRYGIDARYLHSWANSKAGVTALQFQFQDLLGNNVPFWDLPSLGGKYSLRAYGDGRFIDNGMTAINAEERFTVYRQKFAGVEVQGQVAPFAGMGTVFAMPEDVQSKYLRPVVGAAVRAIAPPQVVGSVDVGVGQEGAAIFMDVNYSF